MVGHYSGIFGASIIYKNTPTIVWPREGTGRICFSNYYDGFNKRTWSKYWEIGDGYFTTDQNPAIAEYKGRLFILWRFRSSRGDFFNDVYANRLVYAEYTGNDHTEATKWSGPIWKPLGSTNRSPALVTFQDRLFAIWNGGNDDGIFYASFDGNGWTGQSNIQTDEFQDVNCFKSDRAPSAIVYNNVLYVVWKIINTDYLHCIKYDGQKWYDSFIVYDAVYQAQTPGLLIFDNELYILSTSFVKEDNAISICTIHVLQERADVKFLDFISTPQISEFSDEKCKDFCHIGTPPLYRHNSSSAEVILPLIIENSSSHKSYTLQAGRFISIK